MQPKRKGRKIRVSIFRKLKFIPRKNGFFELMISAYFSFTIRFYDRKPAFISD
ncbi:hypothetical protein LEP1GSC060_1786 [Leptospira weilii serovar Ranarum str. ICFT]|uniref:Uncharacterized protein n=1 Tax=Leptospira weilii serovar Ranarum str. ICFT TaxID=1218598 RepID=N1WLE7_9LEPT|nr:hypothetical protein LEP1GSC060_1786 [Leptospira weilii serovar Ranarum str. ICFT]